MGPNGGWGRDESTAKTYSAATTLLGFGISGSNGFTSTVDESWTAGNTATEVCGNKDRLQDSGVFWNN